MAWETVALYEWHTVALYELCWTLLCLWSVVRHTVVWRRIDHDVDLLESGVIPVSAGVLMWFRNDRAIELDWVAMKAMLAGAGVVQMLAENRDRPLSGWLTVALLFGAVLWIRWRSELRGRRRHAVKVAAEHRVTRAVHRE